MTMLASAADADREDQAGDPRQRHRDRDQLDQREEVAAVDEQPADRDQAEHAVEDDQEHAHDGEPDEPRDQALFERRFAERGRDLRARDQLQSQRQGAGLELAGEVLRRGDREAPGDLRAGRGVDPFGVFGEVDRRNRDQLAVELDREVLQGLAPGHPGQLGFLAAVGDFLGDPFEDRLAFVGEAEGDVGLAAAPGAFVEALLGVGDVRRLSAPGRR